MERERESETTGLCDQLGKGNMRKGRVGNLKIILILETSWIVLPCPEMQTLGRKLVFWGR